MSLNGKIALVTGAHRGIGRASAELLAARGATVIAADILADSPDYGSTAISYCHLDVSSVAGWDDLSASIGQMHGRLDILVNAAGVTQSQSGLHDLDLDEWHRIVEVNQTGTMLGMRMAVTMMLDRGPCAIINISSIWGAVAGCGQIAYHASKGAVSVMTRNAAVTYAKRAVRVNAILPGLIDTEMVRDQRPEMRAATLGATPMGRIGRPEEIAAGVAFLASDEASYITGALLPIDGGFTAQ